MNNKYNETDLKVRKATKDDMGAVSKMVQELANFEKMPDGPKITAKDLQRDGFESDPPTFRCLVAEVANDGSGERSVVGYALYFPIYSTWEGRSMMLEDLYVQPAERRRGVGLRLFNAVAKEAKLYGSKRLDFHVLKWNDARRFYEGRGAEDLTGSEQWCCYRLSGAALARAAEQ